MTLDEYQADLIKSETKWLTRGCLRAEQVGLERTKLCYNYYIYVLN